MKEYKLYYPLLDNYPIKVELDEGKCHFTVETANKKQLPFEYVNSYLYVQTLPTPFPNANKNVSMFDCYSGKLHY